MVSVNLCTKNDIEKLIMEKYEVIDDITDINNMIDYTKTQDKVNFIDKGITAGVNECISINKNSFWHILQGEYKEDEIIGEKKNFGKMFFAATKNDVQSNTYINIDIAVPRQNQTIYIHLAHNLYENYLDYLQGKMSPEEVGINEGTELIYFAILNEYILFNYRINGQNQIIKKEKIDKNIEFLNIQFYYYDGLVLAFCNNKMVCKINVEFRNFKLSIFSSSSGNNEKDIINIKDIIIGNIRSEIYLKPIALSEKYRIKKIGLGYLYQGNPEVLYLKNDKWNHVTNELILEDEQVFIKCILKGEDKLFNVFCYLDKPK